MVEASIVPKPQYIVDRVSLIASIERVFPDVLSNPDKVLMKVIPHMTTLANIILFSNVPCSHRHYAATVQMI